MNMDDIKYICKKWKKNLRLWAVKKCLIVMNSGKRENVEGIGLSNQKSVRTLWQKENYNYLGKLKVDTFKQAEMKGKKEYLKKTRKLYETKFWSRNLMKGINTQSSLPCEILWTILKMNKWGTQTNSWLVGF